MNHPIDFLYQHAGFALKPYMTISDATEGDLCSVCERPSELWLEPTQKVVFSNYGAKESHCLACHALFEGSIELFGIERYAKNTPVPMKLGMLTGCGALITEQGCTLYLNSFIKKMGAEDAGPFKKIELSGRKAHLEIIKTPPKAQQYLYIGNFGRKKKDLVGNLRFSHGDTLYICEESGVTKLNRSLMEQLLEASEGLKKSEISTLKTTLRAYYTGRRSPEDPRFVDQLQNVAEKHPDLWAALRAMPADPHECLNLIQFW